MKKNPFKDFLWERDGNGYYRVTHVETGKTVTAIPVVGGRCRYYRIKESEETEPNYYGQTVPKVYDKFGVMRFCEGREPGAKVHTHTREGFDHA